MGLVQWSDLISSAHGSTAGTTIRRSHGLTVVHPRTQCRRQRRITQQDNAVRFANLVHDWRDVLTPTQRTLWLAYARALELSQQPAPKPTLTALNAFIQFNLTRLLASLPRLVEPPSPPAIIPPLCVPVQMVTYSVWNVRFATVNLPAEYTLLLSLTHARSPAAKAPHFWYRQHWSFTGPINTNQNLFPAAPHKRGSSVQMHERTLHASGRFSFPWIQLFLWP